MGIIQDCARCEQPEIRRAVIFPIKSIKSHVSQIVGDGSKDLMGQDTVCVIENLEDDCHFFGVYDGFGKLGREASLTVNQYIRTYFEINSTRLKAYENDYQIEEFVKELFEGAENKLKSTNAPNEEVNSSGTCCCCVYLKRNKAYILNLGNSRVVLCRTTSAGILQPIDLSADHRVERREEKRRIIHSGGKVTPVLKQGKKIGPERIWNDNNDPWLTCSRALGGFELKNKGLSNIADIDIFEFYQNDKFFVIASDGVWDVMRTDEVIEFIEQQERTNEISKLLVEEAKKRWAELTKDEYVGIGDDPNSDSGHDDISAVVVYLTFYTREEIEKYKSHSKTLA